MASVTKEKKKHQLQIRRRRRIRSVVEGSAIRPRLSVFRSGKHLFAQLIDDAAGVTLCSASDKEVKDAATGDGVPEGRKEKLGYGVGLLIATRAGAKGITAVVFDRGGNTYHGRVKAVADGARAGGLTL
jgi:large subunit ribosomal protein L18